MPLTMEQLRQAPPRKTKSIHVPAWRQDGEDEVCIAVLTAGDMAQLLAIQGPDNWSNGTYILALVARAIVDPETLERIFTDDHIETLKALPGAGLRTVFDAATELNYMAPEQTKELAKNSDTTVGDGSSSGSPSTPGSSTPE